MRVKVSDYIADFLVKNHISTVFTVVGGGAMHLNDSFGHKKEMHCVYQHHEQACSMAADGYARVNQGVAVVCVTGGPGALNALNGVVGAYQDSIPMLVISGQVKSSITVRSSGLNLRSLGGQEFDIASILTNMTKYAEMVMDCRRIKYCLEKALYLATSGRPGPCWLDIPLDVQGDVVEESDLKGFDRNEYVIERGEKRGLTLTKDTIDLIFEKLRVAERPVIYAGNGIRLSGGLIDFSNLVMQMGIPVVTCWDSIDLIETDHPYYAGRGGTMGDRAGNFAVQNSDFLLAIGNRLSVYQVGYDVNLWARKAYVIDVDIDSEELIKPTIRVDLPVCADARIFIKKMLESTNIIERDKYACWAKQCQQWKSKYPVVQERHFINGEKANVYAFIDTLSKEAGEGSVTVVSNGSASVVGSQSYYIRNQQRFIMNCALSSMGYGLPSSIGACIAHGEKIICIEGDGSIQMNIQELQTIVTNRLPIKIFVINNGGYHQIRQTQNNFFHRGLVGVGPESNDLGFPDFEKLSLAYDIPFERICNNSELKPTIRKVLDTDSYYLCEVVCSTDQIFEPKSATRKKRGGSLVSLPLEDMAPFLPREELEKNMYIDLIEEG